MFTKIKKFFLSFLKLNRKTFLFLLFFIFWGALLPLHSAQAFIVELATTIIAFGLWKILLLPLALSSGFLLATGLFLAYVTSPNFLNIPYTTNSFVTFGWELTRNLANMFFILVLVVIALATILRIGDYQAKKTLPLLIIIALLINFTPVITGVIIDFFNILIRFFLGEGIGFNSLLVGYRILGSGIILGFQAWDLHAGAGALMTIALAPVILTIFNLITGVIFLILGFLFIMRPIALMMLVILSPIAFLAYVLPATRSFFTQWWNQFFQWCIIGVIASFFIYLTDQLSFMIFQEGWEGIFAGRGAEEAGGGMFVAFIPVLIVLGFLMMGFTFAITTSAAGASHIIGFGRKTGRWAGKALAVKTGIVAARQYPKAAHKVAEKTAKMSKWLETKGGLPGKLAAKPLRWTERQATGLALHGEETLLKEEQKWEKRLTEKGVTSEQRSRALESGTPEQQVGALLAKISEHESNDLLDESRFGVAKLVKVHQLAKKQNLHKDSAATYLHLYEELEKEELEVTEKELRETAGEQGREQRRELIKKQVNRRTDLQEEEKEIEIERQLTELEGLPEQQKEERLRELIRGKKKNDALDSIFRRLSVKPELIGRINKGAYETGNEDINNRLMQTLNGNIDRAFSTASPEIQELIVNMYQKIIDDATREGKNGFEELVRRYSRAARYLTTGPGARNLGLSLNTGLNPEREERILKRRGLPAPVPSEEEIRKKARQVWQERMKTGEPGTPEDDWREAERILRE